MLTRELEHLTPAQRILLAEELWDSLVDQAQPVTNEEVSYVKDRLASLAKPVPRARPRSWTAVKARLLAPR